MEGDKEAISMRLVRNRNDIVLKLAYAFILCALSAVFLSCAFDSAFTTPTCVSAPAAASWCIVLP